MRDYSPLKFMIAMLAVYCCAALAGCRNFDESFVSKGRYRYKTEERLPAAGIRSVSIEEVNGSVEFLTATGTRIVVGAELVTQAPTDAKARDFAAEFKKVVRVRGDELSISTRYPKGMRGGYGGWINYKVTAPEGVSVKIRTVNGAITARAGAASADVESVNGRVAVSGVSGRLKAVTVNGAVEASDCAGPVFIKTVNGEASYSTKSDAPGEIGVSTVSGEINIEIPAAAKADVEARTVNGEISSELTLENSLFKKTELTGKLNGGGGKISLETVNGRIVISGLKGK